MSAAFLAGFGLLVLGTSFIAGVFGMAGGMILMAVLVILMPVPTAMVLHGTAQMASTAWRALIWRQYIVWPIVARYGIGIAGAALVFAFLTIVPDRRLVLILLGVTPFIVLALPENAVPRVERRSAAEASGFLCAAMQFLSGVSGPLLDVFFVRSPMGRHQVVATKAACQVATHGAKLVYFGVLIGYGSASLEPAVLAIAILMAIIGTMLSRTVLDRLSDTGFRRYTRWIVMTIGLVCIVQGVHGFL